MMVQAKGPKWHQKQKKKGIIPKGLTGIDWEATWCKSKTDGWVYGHGTFSFVAHEIPVLGCFFWMPNSKNEAKRMWMEMGNYQGLLSHAVMDSKADDLALFQEFQKQRKMDLLTRCRRQKNPNPERKKMRAFMNRSEHRQLLKERSYKVEPMQGLVKNIFDLERCWMRGNENNRWIFAAMGLAIQMCQLEAYRSNRSTWLIKSNVLYD